MLVWFKMAHLLILLNYLSALIDNGNIIQSNKERIYSTEENPLSSEIICCSAFQNWPIFGGIGPVCNPNC